MEAAMALLGSEEGLKRAFGLNRSSATSRFKDQFAEFLSENPEIASSINLRHDQIERLAFIAAKENFSDFAVPFLSELHQGFRDFLDGFSSDVQEQHNRLLTETLLPTGLYRKMLGLRWSVVEVDEFLILPDCVAVGYEQGDAAHPLMLCNSDKLLSVVCPVSDRIALVGHRDDGTPLLRTFNEVAAQCSHEFFVAGQLTPNHLDLKSRISDRAHLAIDSAVDLAHVHLEDDLVEPEDDLHYSEGIAIGDVAFSGSISLRLRDFGDEALAERLGRALTDLVTELANDLPLGLVEGFTFAVNYDAALAELDRGIEGQSTLRSFDESYGQGAIMAPVVVRDDRVHVHVVGRADLLLGLISDDEEQRLLSVSSIVYALGHAAHVALLDAAAPKVWFSRIDDAYDARRFNALRDAYSTYFCSRLIGRIRASSYDDNIRLLQDCLQASASAVISARVAHNLEPDFGMLFDKVATVANNVMSFTSRLIGHLHSNQVEIEEDPAFLDILKPYNLDRWAVRYSDDLEALWQAQGQRTGLSAYRAMLDHFDRVMLACGIFVWPSEEGLMIYPQSTTSD